MMSATTLKRFTAQSINLILLGALLTAPLCAAPRLRVSDNKRYLVKEDGAPFFYLGDTAWELFHRLNREEAERYLKDRAAKRFTVIQAVVLAELEGLKDPNPYGATPLADNDPTKPNDAYFQHVDWIVNKAEALGLYIGMLPTWGRWVNEDNIFTEASARQYGEFLGKRYRDKPIIWILGGDRSPNKGEQQLIWRAMAAGIVAGAGDGEPERVMMTFHPQPFDLGSSSPWFHNDTWLDFNMQQNGHCAEVPVWDDISKDYERLPAKPVMDGEPLYEDHPICFNARERGYSVAADIRRQAYWDLFAGAHGHTYGNHSIWQMNAPQRKPINGPLNNWYDALDRPGARQMQYVRALMESRPMLLRVPDQSIIKSSPGGGLKHIQATRATDGSYAFVYIPTSRLVTIDLAKLSGAKIKAWWYNPRNGQAEAIAEYPKSGDRDFTPPDAGENTDWVLVLDDAARKFPPPGRTR